MKRFPVSEGDFEAIELFDKLALFSNYRIDRSTVPEGLYMYEVRHDDDQQGDPCQIKSSILVNFWGTVITNESLELDENDSLLINSEEDWNYTGDSMTIEEYLEEVNK